MASNVSNTGERSSLWEKLALACGLVFVVLIFASASLVAEPPTTASKLSDWFVAHRGVFLTQEYLRVLATFAMMIFIGGVVATIRRVTGRIGPLEMVVVAAGAIFSLMMLISNVAACGAAVVAGKAGVDGGTILALHLFGETMRHVNAIG